MDQVSTSFTSWNPRRRAWPKIRQIFTIFLIKQQNKRRLTTLSPVQRQTRKLPIAGQPGGNHDSASYYAAIAGAAMTVAVSSSGSFAFTLSSPSVTGKVTKADVQQIYYYRRYYYHQYYHHYYHHYYHPYYYHHHYRPYYYHRYYYHPYYYHRYYYRPYY